LNLHPGQLPTLKKLSLGSSYRMNGFAERALASEFAWMGMRDFNTDEFS